MKPQLQQEIIGVKPLKSMSVIPQRAKSVGSGCEGASTWPHEHPVSKCASHRKKNPTYIQLYQLQVLKRRFFFKQALSYLPFHCSRNSLQGKLKKSPYQGDQTFSGDQTGKQMQQKTASYPDNLFQIVNYHFERSLENNSRDRLVILKLLLNDEKKQGWTSLYLRQRAPSSSSNSVQ